MPNITTRTFSLPAPMLAVLREQGQGKLSKGLIALINEELDRARPLGLVPREDLQRVPIRVDPAFLERIRLGRARRHVPGDLSDAVFLARLAYTAYMDGYPDETVSGLDEFDDLESHPVASGNDLHLPVLAGMTYREAQKSHIEAILQAVEGHRVVPLESATGTGKGLVLAAAALMLARQGRTVVIASPSHRIAGQTMAELESLIDANPGFDPRPETIRGRQEFVSDERIEMYIEAAVEKNLYDPDVIRELKDWFARQLEMKDRGWLFNELEAVCPDIPRDALALRAEDSPHESLASKAYHAQFERARESRILFVTHVMLAIDHRYRELRTINDRPATLFSGDESWVERWSEMARARYANEAENSGLLPNYDALLIDEAHELERSVATVRSDGVAVHSMAHAGQVLSGHVSGIGNALHEMRLCMDTIRQMGSDGQTIRFERGHEMFHSVRRLESLSGEILRKLPKRKKLPDAAERARRILMQDHDVLARIVGRKTDFRLETRFSPKREYPTFWYGPRTVRRTMTEMWARVCMKGGAALLSATLYTPRYDGSYTPTHVVNELLSVPASLMQAEPTEGAYRNIPDWVTDPIVLHRPEVPFGKAERHPWFPPSAECDIEDWAASVGDLIENTIANESRGGTIVLLTSYEAIEALEARFEYLAGRLIVSRRHRSFERTVEDYMVRMRQGRRPVWLATGRAWTGMNISPGKEEGVEASDDYYIADLVIPRLPFRQNRTTTHAHRVENGAGFAVECRDVILRLRQGMGRMVRRPGVPRRNLWILDPRAFDQSKTYAPWFTNFFDRYRGHRTVILEAETPRKAEAA